MDDRRYFRRVSLKDSKKENNQEDVLFSFFLEPIEVFLEEKQKSLLIDVRIRQSGITIAKSCRVTVVEEDFHGKLFTKMIFSADGGPLFIFVKIFGKDWILIHNSCEKSITSDSIHALHMLANEYEHAFKTKTSASDHFLN